MTPLIQAIAGAFQTAMAGVQGAAQPQGGGNGLPLERLRHLGGVEFKGLPPERSEDDAYAWWTTVISSLDEDEITWEFFQSAFRKRYLGTRYEDEKKREFMALVQGSMLVADYEIQFVRLSQYAPELVPTERDRCDRFRYGLTKEDIEQSLGLPARASESSICKRPTSWDRDSAKRHKDRRYQPEPRCGGGNPGRGHQGQGIFQRAPECARCGRCHIGECWGNESTCWNYGMRGHMRRDCPHPARVGQAPVRVAEPQRGRRRGRGNFQRGNDGQRNVAHVVAVQQEGGGPARVLLDVPCEVLDVGVNVKSSFGDTVVVRKLYRRCLLMIQGYVFPVDMMELPFYGFDVILGMDWLVEHRARVDFETKRVLLKLADDHEIVVVGENIKFLSNVISVLEAQRLMDDGCRAYLAYVMNPNMGEVRSRDIRTVCDFSGVFPEELPGLPPDREVEFVIETHADSAPVSISPYHMAPKELKELKTQLQELLDR
ncbi:hypothetical protein V6N11_021722 [Hibiscus sabdariffa]|uniref:Retrotransposon gag domain-containing protein n=1 Tax=Hibiscus sabdariffa TaxID=183260 RepID=A0ABR2TH12_9ROSI